MSVSGWEALSDVWELSGGPPGCPEVVRWPSRMSGSGREALPEVREALLEVRESLSDVPEWSRGPPRYPSGREALPDVREWSRGPSRYPSGRKALPDVPDWSEVFPEVLELSGGPP